MKDRIVLLIKAKNLTAAQFADEIGVQKSSISHIISGRNNASLDFIQKVLLCYPDVSMEWLMFGKGPIFRSNEISTNSNKDGHYEAVASVNKPPVDLFSVFAHEQVRDFSTDNDLSAKSLPEEKSIKKKNQEGQNEISLIDSMLQNNDPLVQKIETKPENTGNKNLSTKMIIKIVEFYKDNTFREYYPE